MCGIVRSHERRRDEPSSEKGPSVNPGLRRTLTSRPPPEILKSYLTFCEVRERYRTSRKLELDADFVFPTTLLPLAILIAKSHASLLATAPAVQGYANWIMTADDPPSGGTYVPLVRLPKHPEAYQGVLKRLQDLSESTKLFSVNRDAYHYLLSELIDNIYEHAQADRAYVMAQCYVKKGLIEASFMDDGVTIPKSLAAGTGKAYPEDEEHLAVFEALNGRSSKGGGYRGFGLQSSSRIVSALGGEFLIVSGRGAVVTNREGQVSLFTLTSNDALEGTLVGFRVQDVEKRINLYELVEGKEEY
jgi:anti-sigma regulatory factor (Ser/Thr protein kinase)